MNPTNLAPSFSSCQLKANLVSAPSSLCPSGYVEADPRHQNRLPVSL